MTGRETETRQSQNEMEVYYEQRYNMGNGGTDKIRQNNAKETRTRRQLTF